MQYFDFKAIAWKPLTTLPQAPEIYNSTAYPSPYALILGCKLFVGSEHDHSIATAHRVHCYDIERNVWEKLHYAGHGPICNLCSIADYMYPILSNVNNIPKRYSLAKCRWERFAKLSIQQDSSNSFYCSGGTVLNSKLYVLYGHRLTVKSSQQIQNAVLLCFDPLRNRWEKKSSTCQPHFGSSLFVVSGKMYVAGGYASIEQGKPGGKPAPVEVYDKENNTWSVVKQSRIPPNELGAVEIDDRVYFIINKFPIDSGIRIRPGELYPVHLDEWQNLGEVDKIAALCYIPLKRESLNVE